MKLIEELLKQSPDGKRYTRKEDNTIEKVYPSPRV